MLPKLVCLCLDYCCIAVTNYLRTAPPRCLHTLLDITIFLTGFS
jgi:hypothetical protein